MASDCIYGVQCLCVLRMGLSVVGWQPPFLSGQVATLDRLPLQAVVSSKGNGMALYRQPFVAPLPLNNTICHSALILIDRKAKKKKKKKKTTRR
eukprot:TRINITY_DN6475_c0_g1_i1.p2 TRINITY_DN6475_c0_g1~~TRINITY_DN6475_c0_g1_i1.p2  ORF type:complete len:94 (+),score=30.82 TRINITY_DN6475_c0_g1_i1:175-456(+)